MSSYSTTYSKSEVKDSLCKCVDEHEKVTQATLHRDDDDLVNTSDVYAYWNTLDDARSSINGIEGRSTSKSKLRYSKSELVDIIKRCHKKHGEVTRDKLRNDDEFPSLTPINRVFGDLDRARREAGIDTTVDIKQEVAEQFDAIDSRDEVERRRDGNGLFPNYSFIYTIELTREDGEVYYYVGSASKWDEQPAHAPPEPCHPRRPLLCSC